MKKDYYDIFASPENLRIAFKYVKLEIEKSSLPLDPFWVPGVAAVEKLGDAFFNSLSKLLLERKYEPGKAEEFLQHKENFGIRKIAMINIVDRIVYQAILNKKVLGKEITGKYNKHNYYPTISKSKKAYLKSYKGFYPKFIEEQRRTVYDKSRLRGEFDVTAFYDNISHKILRKMLDSYDIGTPDLNDLLIKLLSKWSKNGKGVPQGPDASSVLANFYLTPIDEYFERQKSKNIDYFRYMDDMVIMANSEKDLYTQIESLTEQLYKLQLDLNTKSEIIQADDNYFELLQYFDPYGEPGNESAIVLEEIRSRIPEIILKYRDRRKDVTKRDRSSLKYFLKADKEYKYAKFFVQIYPYVPSLADLICKYIQPVAYKGEIRINILKVLTEHHLFRWQEFWLAKVLLIEKIQRDHNFEIRFDNHKYWEVSSTARFVTMLAGKSTLSHSDILKAIESSETEFDRNLYISLLSSAHKNASKTKDVLKKCLEAGSLETKAIIYAQSFDQKKLAKVAKAGNLFESRAKDTAQTSQVTPLQFLSKKEIEKTLGFSPEFNSRKEMSLELRAENDELTITGKLLDGRSCLTAKSQRPRLIKLIKCLCKEHMGTEKSVYRKYQLKEVVNKHAELKEIEKELAKIDLSIEKANRLTPVLAPTLGYFIKISYTSGGCEIQFRRGIDDDSFAEIPDKKQKEIFKAAASTMRENTVNN